MWPYVVLIILPLIMQHVKIKHNSTLCISTSFSNYSTTPMKVFWIFLFILLVLRHEVVGIDIRNYAFIFEMISQGSWTEAIGRSAEIGYSFLNKFVSVYTNDFRYIIIISAFLSVWFISKAYIRYSSDAALTISLFITMSNFVLLFSGLRQAIAISIGFVAFEAVKEKKKVLFIVTVVVAILFHTSAFMLLFMYPLYYLRITKKWLFAIVPLMVCLWIFNKQIFGFLAVFLMRFTKYDAEISSTGAVTMLILFMLFTMFSFVIPDDKELDDDTIGMRNFLIFAVMLQMFAPLHSLAMRMSYYYIVFIPLLIPRIIGCRSFRWNQVAIMARHIMVVFFIIYFFATAPSDNVLETFPYHFLWENL